ncbi:hypothetical protein F5Y17DRAFT_416241 [Xylariaceae sp. FL0594]|nr:hypothetical protein F5Y17DRAFT_416241 [Xylariaceae sp. FL0594]
MMPIPLCGLLVSRSARARAAQAISRVRGRVGSNRIGSGVGTKRGTVSACRLFSRPACLTLDNDRNQAATCQ